MTEPNPSTKLDATIRLHSPPLNELTRVLQEGLKENFAVVAVDVVDCPDLSRPPFLLAAKGIGGHPNIADVGGPGNMFPFIRKAIYNLFEVCETAKLPSCYALGAGAGPIHLLGYNTEMVHNAQITRNNRSKFESYVIYNKEPTTESPKPYLVRQLTNDTAAEFSMMGNFLLSDGAPTKVLKVNARKRTGENNFVTHMRIVLKRKYGEHPVGLGGVFMIKSGKIKIHVMPELPRQPFRTKESIDEWLKYYDMDAPLICASVFVSYDPGYDLRIEHTHCYSNHGDGGHYHYDITPHETEYEGYFIPAENIYRIDQVPG